ncbi:MAG TPA: hypothetical protein HPP83_02010 [Candidatus Hydrogenedentes bacterium]|nr:hypothetical protein [Candidatus Hydrogenedentota bacterium]
METPWLTETKRTRALARNEAFWRGELEEYPLMWVTVTDGKPGCPPPELASDVDLWTNAEYVVEAAEDRLARMHYAGDAVPVYVPWLGPDQFAAWLGAELTLLPRKFTSWVKPFVEDWSEHTEFHIDPDNRWWKLYLRILRHCVERGKDKWVTGYPDLHTGIDALRAIRGSENLAIDLVENPEAIHRAMRQMTDLFKYVVDTVSDIVMPTGQGTSNWTMGWSSKRYLCIGQNDSTCMLSPEMFEMFCWEDNVETSTYADISLFHMDGPGIANHLDKILQLDGVNCIQWIQGAGAPPPSKWIGLLRRIQEGGKSVQVYYGKDHGAEADLIEEIGVLCQALDPTRLFIWADVASVAHADAVVEHAHRVCREKHGTLRRISSADLGS